MVLLALFGAVMGQGVIWYTGQFYAQNFLETKCNIEFEQSRTILLWAIVFATPFFIFWGWLSDKVGRKWIMMAGLLLGILTYRPIFDTFLKDTDTKEWMKTLPASGADERIKFSELYNDPENSKKMSSYLENGNLMKVVALKQDTIKEKNIIISHYYNQYILKNGPTFKELRSDTIFVTKAETEPLIGFSKEVKYMDKILPKKTYWKFVGLVFLLILYVTMAYGPVAAFLVELFPTKIRYTSMSLPYHIGNGVFGGLVPFIGLLLTTTYKADPLVGLWYPIAVATLCFIIGVLYLNNKIDNNIND
jgi:MFS family permease